MKGGSPDRFVNQYEAFSLVFGAPCAANRRLEMGAAPVKDGWGVTRAWPVGTPGGFPLHDAEHLVCKDITAWRDYVKAPQVYYPDSAWEQTVKNAENVNRKEQFALAAYMPGIFETCHNLLGLEECLMAFYEEPECMHELIDYITDYFLAVAKETCDRLHPDGIFQHDDWGTHDSTFLSPDMFEEFFLPSYKKIYGYYISRGADMIVHHSDSYAATLVPYMIEMGIKVWQGVIPTNNVPELIKKYGDKITFMGGIDDGHIDVENWTPELVEAEVRRACTENGKLHYIPSLCQGVPMSIYPGVHEAVTDCIDKMSAELF